MRDDAAVSGGSSPLSGGSSPPTRQTSESSSVVFLLDDVQSALLARGIDRPIIFITGHGDIRSEQAEIGARLARLTRRERQVLCLLTTGLLNKQIAAMLGLAEKTIKVHRGRLMRKMHVRTATALVGLLNRA
jgi:FixJ family two-component response regulator